MILLININNMSPVPMKRFMLIAPLALFSAAAGAVDSAPHPSRAEARLIGAWQQDLTPQIAKTAPEQRAKLMKAGALGGIFVFKADHRFEMYPPCGAKQDDLRKIGLQSIAGTWQLGDAGELTLKVSHGKRTLEQQGTVQWIGGQLSLLKKGNLLPETVGKYEGPLPPKC